MKGFGRRGFLKMLGIAPVAKIISVDDLISKVQTQPIEKPVPEISIKPKVTKPTKNKTPSYNAAKETILYCDDTPIGVVKTISAPSPMIDITSHSNGYKEYVMPMRDHGRLEIELTGINTAVLNDIFVNYKKANLSLKTAHDFNLRFSALLTNLIYQASILHDGIDATINLTITDQITMIE